MKHAHHFKARKPDPTVLVCDCGRFQHVVSPRNPAIVEASADHEHLPMSNVWKRGNTEVCRYCYQTFTVA